jgi:uncharacterized protein YkwD
MRFTLFVVFAMLQCLASADDVRSVVAAKINLVRKSKGLTKLVPNELLAQAAQSQSDWMASVGAMEHLREEARSYDGFRICNYHPANRVINSGYFSFEDLFDVSTNENGSTTVFAKAAANDNVGEIIARGVGPGSNDVYDPVVMVRGWMNSPGHRKEILNGSYEEFGVGFSSPRYGETYWCVVFANPN